MTVRSFSWSGGLLKVTEDGKVLLLVEDDYYNGELSAESTRQLLQALKQVLERPSEDPAHRPSS